MDTEPQLTVEAEHRQGQYNPQQYLAALERMNKRSDLRITVIRVVVIIALLAALPWAIRYYFNLGGGSTLFFWMIAVFVAVDIVPLFWSGGSFNWQMSKLGDQLMYSGLADRLALGQLDSGDPIYEHTPWVFRRLLPRNPQRDPELTLKRVTASLQWYAAAPRRHIRPTWIIPIAFLPMLLVFAPPFMFSSRGLSGPFGPGLDPISLVMLLIFASIPMMFEVLHRTQLQFLTKYLREAWAFEPGGATNENAATDSGRDPAPDAVEVDRRYKILQTVNQVQQDLEQGLMQMAIPLMWMWMVALMPISMVGMLGSRSLLFMFLIPLVPIMLLFGTIKLANSGFKAYRATIRERLETSGLAIAIASGELDYDGPVQATPLLLRWTHSWPRMPRGFADTLRLRIWRAAFNLDWYLDRPAVLFRRAWAANLLLVGATILSFVLMVFLPVSSIVRSISASTPPPGVLDIITSTHAFWLVPLIIGLGLPGFMLIVHTRIWSDELIRHLRECLAG